MIEPQFKQKQRGMDYFVTELFGGFMRAFHHDKPTKYGISTTIVKSDSYFLSLRF